MAKKRIAKWFKDNIPENVLDSELFKFTINLSDKQTIAVDMATNIGIEYDDILTELEEIPSIYVYWAAMYSHLKEQCALLDRKIKARRGMLTKAMLEKYTKNQVRLTDKQLYTLIEGDKVLNDLEDKKEMMNKQTGKLYFMVQAIQMKGDNLRSLAGFAKQDMSNQR